MSPEHKAIRDERKALEREHRIAAEQFWRQWRNEKESRFAALYARCSTLGHLPEFDGFNVVRDPLYRCVACGTRVTKEADK